jgi:hypothetical protein
VSTAAPISFSFDTSATRAIVCAGEAIDSSTFGQATGIDVNERDCRAFPRKADRGGATDARGRTGDQRPLAGETLHDQRASPSSDRYTTAAHSRLAAEHVLAGGSCRRGWLEMRVVRPDVVERPILGSATRSRQSVIASS